MLAGDPGTCSKINVVYLKIGISLLNFYTMNIKYFMPWCIIL